MKKLLEAINRGILRGLNEQNIELLADLDDENLDQMDSLQTKSINNKTHALYRFFPKTKEELVEIIKAEVERKGWNCSLNHINVSQITDMSYIFAGANIYSDYESYDLEEFNGDISRWDVSNVENMKGMFQRSNYTGNNGDLSNWNVSKVEDMCATFAESQYIGELAKWNVSNVTNMNSMFYNTMFIGDISKWKPIKVKDMCSMFWGFGNENSKFNAKNFDISKWDVSSVTDMNAMFAHSSFNSDISNWNVRSVLDMRQMFMCSDFYQDISKWKVNTKCETYDIFDNCPIDKGDFPDKFKPKGI